MLTSAYELINIESGVDYKEGCENGKSPIFRIHALKDNGSEVIIESFMGDSIKFPPGSFVCGAVYDILIKKMKFDKTKCQFVGYKFKSKPHSLDL